jgi:hypothetical protein
MGITFEIPLFWILFFTASVLTLLIYLFFLEKSVAEERNRSLYSEGQLVEIIGYVNSLPDDQWQKHAVKRSTSNYPRFCASFLKKSLFECQSASKFDQVSALKFDHLRT